MGLAGRKIKQRIPNDPRNLAWSENAAKFGHTYLAKLGWTPLTGLGVAGDGRTTNIAVAQKLDQLGIGAGRSGAGAERDSIAWRQQNEFEAVLARLNSASGSAEPPKTGVVTALGFIAQSTPETPVPSVEASVDILADESVKDKKKKSKKRKLCDVGGEDDATSKLKSDTTTVEPPRPRRFAHHRARLLNSKRIAGKSATEIAEILGVASSSSSPTTVPSTPTIDGTSGTLTPISDERITASSTSVSDYFKEKMAKLRIKHKWMAEPSPSSDSILPSAAPFRDDHPDVEERARIGFGARRELVDLAAFTSTSAPTSIAFPSPILSAPPSASEPPSVAKDTTPTSLIAKDDRKAKRKHIPETEGNKKDKKKSKGRIITPLVVDGNMDVSVDDADSPKTEREVVKKKRRVDANEVSIAVGVDADSGHQRKKNKKGKIRKAE